ncbi:hypothetical protein H5410_002352, partial [Solanum commersonii]
ARWKSLRVGDLIKVYKDGIYVETSNLDGNTNLKVKHALNITSSLHDDDSFQNFKVIVKCEDPNEDPSSFIGTLCYNNHHGIQIMFMVWSFLLVITQKSCRILHILLLRGVELRKGCIN